MKYKDFLFESEKDSSYKDEIELNDAVDIFINHCKDSDLNKPLWRGMRSKNPYYVFEGQKSGRSSISRFNYHNIIIDQQIKENNLKFPMRSKSIIAIGSSGRDLTDEYGSQKYALFPYDKVAIGVCKKPDILEMAALDYTINKINALLSKYVGVNAATDFDQIVDKISSYPYKSDSGYLSEYFNGKSKDEIKDTLFSIYDIKKFGLSNSKKISGKNNEVWIGGKCLAIHSSQLIEFQQLVNNRLKSTDV